MPKSSQLIDSKKLYSLDEAVELVKKTSKAKFDATIEVHARLGIDTKKGEQQVRGTVALPHGAGKVKRVAAFVGPDKEKEAKDAGADLVGGEELIKEIGATKKIAFDIAVATPDMMPKLAKVAKILGPKGLMPNPKTDTVGADIGKLVSEQKRGKLSFKNDDTGNVHVAVGKASMSASALKENAKAFLDTLRRAKPPTSKGLFLQGITMCATMGPGIKVAYSS